MLQQTENPSNSTTSESSFPGVHRFDRRPTHSSGNRINRPLAQAQTGASKRAPIPVPAPERSLEEVRVQQANSAKIEPVDVASCHSFASRQALKFLRQAFLSAVECNRNVWEFSVEMAELSEAGIGKHVLRKLVCQGMTEHRREVFTNENQRSFVPEKELMLSNRSCFVLTSRGMSEATRIDEEDRRLSHRTNNGHNAPLPQMRWDPVRRELICAGVVVKRFKWPAPNQERVLMAFQEQDWSRKIDDPLPPDDKVCPKRRLHDTIKCLNRNQVNRIIKFRGDGTGQGVFWEVIEKKETSPSNPSTPHAIQAAESVVTESAATESVVTDDGRRESSP